MMQEINAEISVTGAGVDLAHVVEENSDGIVVFDRAGTYLFVNHAAEQILSRSRADLLGRTVWDLFPESKAENGLFLPHFRRALNGQVSSYELFSAALSRWLHVHLVPSPVHKSHQDTEGMTLYFRDVTAQMQAEQRSTEWQSRFQIMANSAPVLVWISDKDARGDWFNRPWLEFTGRTLEQERGDGWTEGIHPDDFERSVQTYLDSFYTHVPFAREYRLRRQDGQYRWFLDKGVPLFAKDGTFSGFIGSCVDISEQREAAERQRRFVRDMLASVTEGRLWLCSDPSDLPPPFAPASGDVELTPLTLRLLRKTISAVAEELHLPTERTQDLLTAAGEAGMNAVNHGGGGTARIFADPANRIVQVWIQDNGKGIRDEDLHRATLEKGWSGGNSLGHGFYLMLRTCDRTYLLTGGQGTTVVLEQESTAPKPAWL